MEYRTFGEYSDRRAREEVESGTAILPDSVRLIIAELVINLADVVHLRELAFRNCDKGNMLDALAIRDLASTQADGQVYYPALDDIAAAIDWPSLHYAALKTAAATERAERRLLKFRDRFPKDINLEFETPYGNLAIFSPDYHKDKLPARFRTSHDPPGGDRMPYDANNSLLIIDFGRDIAYYGSPGAAASPVKPVSVVIDLGGDDYYSDPLGRRAPSAGVGFWVSGWSSTVRETTTTSGERTPRAPGLGEATWREGFDRPKRLYAYNSYNKSFGGFIDIRGRGAYYLFEDGKESPHPSIADNSLWFQPAKTDSLFGSDNCGVGIDTERGTVPELFKWEE